MEDISGFKAENVETLLTDESSRTAGQEGERHRGSTWGRGIRLIEKFACLFVSWDERSLSRFKCGRRKIHRE